MAGKGRTPLTPQQVDAIKIMVANKKFNGAIATSLELKKSTVAYVAAIVRRPEGPARKENRGRPKALSEHELRGLRRVVQDSPFASMAEIAEKLNAERTSAAVGPSIRPLSVRTVRAAVKDLGLSFYAPAKKLFVSPANMVERLQCGKDHESWTYHWAFVFFSDDSSFLVRQPQARRVSRQSGPWCTSANLRPTFKSGRASVMVWGGYFSMGRTPLTRMGGSMNASSYSELLENEVVHYLFADFGGPDEAWFQEDMAPCHTAKACKAVKLELGIKVLPWVGQSPDLNSAENAWAELKRRLRKRSTAPKSQDELFFALQQEWAAIPSSYFKKLVESMPRRVQSVMAARGASTKY